MNKLSLLGMMTLMIGATLYFLLQGTKTDVAERAKLRPQVSKTQELFLGARDDKGIISKTLSVTSTCDELSKKLDEIDFNVPIDEWIETISSDLVSGCSEPEFKGNIAALKKSCIDELSDQECSYNALILRSLLRTKGVEDSDDRAQLADLVLREFGNGNPNFEKLMKYSEKLMDQNPDQLSFHKLWAMSKVISGMSQKISPTEFAEEIEVRVHPDVWRDKDMVGVDLALKTGLEPIGVEGAVREKLAEREDSQLHELLGWALWKQNRKKEAIQELRKVLSSEPGNTWAKEQLKNITAKNAGPDAYKARLTMNFTFDDLFQ